MMTLHQFTLAGISRLIWDRAMQHVAVFTTHLCGLLTGQLGLEAL
jgi:hypothetical protein